MNGFSLSPTGKRVTVIKTHSLQILIIYLLTFLLLGCANQEEPLQAIESSLVSAPAYSIILNDMKEEGTFSKSYFHQYKIIQGKQTYLTDWLRISKKVFARNQGFLGMTLISKTEDGQRSNTPYPPGYNHVGNSQYGEWRRNSSGNSFWAFYGQYAFMRSMFGWGGRTIYRTDYNGYRTSQRSNRPYYGANREYGTNGSISKRTNPGFFERRMAKQKQAKSRFSQRVQRRFGGSRSVAGRGGGFGK